MYEEEEKRALQWIALASPREEAAGRIISFLLMSSTSSREGVLEREGRAITLEPPPTSPPPVLSWL